MFTHIQSTKKSGSPLQAKAVPQGGKVLTDNRNKPIQLMPRSGKNYTAKQRDSILNKNQERNGGFHRCASCGFMHTLRTYATYRGTRSGDGGFHVDHVRAVARGGRPLIRNAQVLCGTCNTSKGSRKKAKRFGINKYKGLHMKNYLKDYQNKRRNY